MNLIILHPEEVDAQGRCTLSGKRAQHMRKVLNVEIGKKLRIGLLNGPTGIGVVEQVEKHAVVLMCEFEQELPPIPRIDLLLAMPRPKVMKRLWAQLAALGVGRIVLLRAEKVERYYFDSHVVDPEYYTDLLIEGLQQARCTRLPQVLVRPLFKPFVEDELDGIFPNHIKLLANPSGERRLMDGLSEPVNDKRVVLSIGPEGGWSPYELQALESHGFLSVSMGRRILRSDTATIGLVSMLAEYLSMP